MKQKGSFRVYDGGKSPKKNEYDDDFINAVLSMEEEEKREKALRQGGKQVCEKNVNKAVPAGYREIDTPDADTKRQLDAIKRRHVLKCWQLFERAMLCVCIGCLIYSLGRGPQTKVFYISCITFLPMAAEIIRQLICSIPERKRYKKRRAMLLTKESDDDDMPQAPAKVPQTPAKAKLPYPSDIKEIKDSIPSYIRSDADVFAFCDRFFMGDKDTDLEMEKTLFNMLLLYTFDTKKSTKFSYMTVLLDEMTADTDYLSKRCLEEEIFVYPLSMECHLFDRCLDVERKRRVILKLSEKLNFLKGKGSYPSESKRLYPSEN
ncbi:MAG: hypothetical protein ACI4CS_08135 [Candidatus Weimeria sp.]